MLVVKAPRALEPFTRPFGTIMNKELSLTWSIKCYVFVNIKMNADELRTPLVSTVSSNI